MPIALVSDLMRMATLSGFQGRVTTGSTSCNVCQLCDSELQLKHTLIVCACGAAGVVTCAPMLQGAT